MRSLIQANDTVFSNPSAYKGTIKPGWSDYVAELYNAHVACLWRNAGKPGNGDLFELLRVSKARYKYALRFIKRNEADMRKESLGNKLADSDSRDFWKEIKGGNNAKMPLPTYIEGVARERERERQVYLQPDGLDSNTYNTYNINIIKYLQYGRHTGTTNICLLPIVQSPWY